MTHPKVSNLRGDSEKQCWRSGLFFHRLPAPSKKGPATAPRSRFYKFLLPALIKKTLLPAPALQNWQKVLFSFCNCLSAPVWATTINCNKQFRRSGLLLPLNLFTGSGSLYIFLYLLPLPLKRPRSRLSNTDFKKVEEG